MFSLRLGRTRGDCTSAARAARGPSSRYWFIVKNEYGRIEALSIDLDGQEAMPIFSFREEAEMFIRFEAWGDWSVRETSAGELISLLSGPYSDVKMVALDLLPEICDKGMRCLVSVGRKDFARTLLRDRGVRDTTDPPSRLRRERTSGCRLICCW